MADFVGKLGLVTFSGLAAPGNQPLLGINPGDLILDVVSLNGDGFNYTHSFLREVQINPAAASGSTNPFIVQVDSTNLSALKFVALIERKNP